MSHRFDLAAYLARIGLAERPARDVEGLAQLQRAHRLAIPFENLDVRLGRGIDLAPDALVDKLVRRRRGGYCFEQNALFLLALEAIGFAARPLLARVRLGAVGVPPLTHTLNLVELPDGAWIADAGFGGSYTPPLPLRDGAAVETADGAAHRLALQPDGAWLLERHGPAALTDGRGGGDGWEPQYSFTLAEVWPADLALSNHWTSTAPGTRFTSLTVVSIVLPRGFASLTDRSYTRRNGQEEVRAEIVSARMLRMRLGLVFGIELDEVEIAALGLFDA